MNGRIATVALNREAGNPADSLYRRARDEPDRTAFFAGGESWSYRRLADETGRLARAMRALGIQTGDPVALHMANSGELAAAYFACFHIGALAVPLNTRLKTAELRSLLLRLRPALYLGQSQFYPQIAPIEPDILASAARFVVGDAGGEAVQPWESLLAKAAAAERLLPHRSRADAPAVLLATSGTTGQPKLVIHTPATLSAIVASFTRFGLGGGQTVLLMLPMMHGAALTILLSSVHFGVPMVMLDHFDPESALAAIETRQCSWTMGTPQMFAELLQRQRERPRRVSALRQCLSIGDVCPPVLQEQFAGVFGGVPLRSVLGSTEAVWSLTYGAQPGPVCRVPPGTEVRLVDDAGQAVPRGETGELLVRSSSVSPGYWTGPGRIEGAPEDGWCRTGDLMRQDGGGDLWFVARKKDIILRGGSNIAPAEVEQALLAHPAVHDAMALGVPDPVLGQRVAALVQLNEGCPAHGGAILDEIHADVAMRLADYKVPERLHAVAAIPRNAMGKVDRAAALGLLPGADPAMDRLK